MYSKDTNFPDAPFTDPTQPWQNAREFMANGPRLHEYIKEMNRETFAKYGYGRPNSSRQRFVSLTRPSPP